MSTKIYPSEPLPVPLPKVSEPSIPRRRETTRKQDENKSDATRHLTTPRRLDNVIAQHGKEGQQKPCFSLSAAKVKQENILYFGVHGDVTKLSLSDRDVDTLMDVLEDLKDVSS